MQSKKFLFLIVSGLFFLTSCHSDRLHLNYTVQHDAKWNSNHSQLAFIASTKAYRQAIGISAWPDGGSPDYLFEKAGLYLFTPAKGELKQLAEFNALAQQTKSRWKTALAFQDSVIYFQIIQNTNWQNYLKWAHTHNDSLQIYFLKEKYKNPFAITIRPKQIQEIDSITFATALIQAKDFEDIKSYEITSLLSQIPVSAWGFNLQQIYPKTEEEYISDLIYAKKGDCALTKRAIIEQIISGKSPKEIQEIIEKMDEYKNTLKPRERKEYELFSEETYMLLRKHL